MRGGSLVNGIYSYFIRSEGIDIGVDELGELRRYAVKVVEVDNAILYVGRFWVVYVWRVPEMHNDMIVLKCSDGECWTSQVLEPDWVTGIDSRPLVFVNIDYKCEEWHRPLSSEVEHICFVTYRFARHKATIAVTVDPVDITSIAGDDELKLLLKLISRSGPLIRPM